MRPREHITVSLPFPLRLFRTLSLPLFAALARNLDGMYLTGVCAVFAGKDPSRALATSSLKPEDCVPEWSDLKDENKTVLSEWYTFFSKRYNVVGKVQGATNL
jgi:hypothetical protein